jgi:hypothetical protein
MTTEIGTSAWRRSSRCGGGACLELAASDGAVHARDAKDQAGASLGFSSAAWQQFVAGVKRGQFVRSRA